MEILKNIFVCTTKTGKYVLSFDENEWSCQFWITSNAYGDDNTDFELIGYGEHLYLNSDYVYKIRCKGNYWNYDQSIKRKFRFNISDLSSKTLILGKNLKLFMGEFSLLLTKQECISFLLTMDI